ncbi:putative toxin-antitoxin system toxin component, PIN family [Mucilaginibacter pedocola]|uniref:Putative toxin-antitoxin system toxin component, PIN family n=1 Tax=Mucilaginibacter pedocola TaxID=1792845 RepID=A0A1S9PI89_9SPHI|nr:putative toxin-antitoxin system toxin component, PIN family [Mucilaginibacter pedocola]OOQ60654.1 putative toxin-antitoxin system toxin component, PIN family [Mucilaginibacter pedocola]
MKNKFFVFDTNTLISASIAYTSNPKKAVDKARRVGKLLFSNETLNELSLVLMRRKFDKYISLEDRLVYLQRVEKEATIRVTTSNFTDCRDVKDNIFLNLAFDWNAECIISGDTDLLILNPFKEIPIITPTQFLEQYS